MPQLIFDRSFLEEFHQLQPVVRNKVLDLPRRFSVAANAGLHLEALVRAVDNRIRTVRVDNFYRGVVVTLGDGVYALLRVMPHDDAIAWACKQRFGVNPVTGIIEIIDIQTAEQTVAELDKLSADHPSSDADHVSPFASVRDRDFQSLGVDSQFIPILRRLHDEAEVLSIAALMPRAQADAVLFLAEGLSPEEAWQRLAEEYLLTDAKVDTADIDAALNRPATRAEFVVTSSDKELMALLTGDFEAWRTFLHPTQRSVAENPKFNGPFRLTGGAGTGKTVVAMHRARFLAHQVLQSPDPTGRILFATFTNSLADHLARTLRSFCSDDEFHLIDVLTVDKYAQNVLRSSGIQLRAVAGQDADNVAIQAATEAALDELGLDGRFLLAEWNEVVIGRRLTSFADYATSPRPGRGRSLSRPSRQRVWEAITILQGKFASQRTATFQQIASRAADVLSGQPSRYRHVVIDEAQDLHPAQWRLMRASVPHGPNDMFIAGDAHQRIYDGRVSLASVGIETRGRSRRLKLNYRTSQQILGWALGILTGRHIDDLDGNAEQQAGYRSEFQGPPPIVRAFSTSSDESSFVAETVKEWISVGVPAGAIGVLARTRVAYAGVVEALGRLSIGTSEIGKNYEPGTIFIGTMHASKGLEFARLAVVGASANMVPLPASVVPSTEDPARHELDITRERCLLYVACTRARDTLVVTSVGSPSPFLPSIAP